MTRFHLSLLFRLTITLFFFLGRPLWGEDGSVVYSAIAVGLTVLLITSRHRPHRKHHSSVTVSNRQRLDRAWLRWRGPAATVNYRTALSSERALQNNTRNGLKKILRRKKNCSRVPDGGLTPRLTGRLTVGRNVTSTSTSTSLLCRHACLQSRYSVPN
jgi:hypothetical protein